MAQIRPYLEKVVALDDSSWSMLRRPRDPAIPFEWHHHPEYELTLTLNSMGHRFIGDHVGEYKDGDLVLIGPGIPHSWASTGKYDPNSPHVVNVVWFKPEWIGRLTDILTELRALDGMLERASRGLKFSAEAAQEARPMIEGLFGKPPIERVTDLLTVLSFLATDQDAEPLTAPNHHQGGPATDRPRIDRILDYVHANYARQITLDEVAEVAALSPSSVHRLFLRHTRLNLSEYVMRLRVGAACSKLITSDQPVSLVAEAVGYQSLANFGRQFKALKGLTPREYRQRFSA